MLEFLVLTCLNCSSWEQEELFIYISIKSSKYNRKVYKIAYSPIGLPASLLISPNIGNLTPICLLSIVIGPTTKPPGGELKFTQASEKVLASDDVIIKAPSLLSYRPDSTKGPDDLLVKVHNRKMLNAVLARIKLCEAMQRNPHANLAEYLGCRVSKIHVTGLCFRKYADSLEERLNPEHLNKCDFKYEPGMLKDRDGFVRQLKSAIQHLHFMDLVHNNIYPRNIVFQGQKGSKNGEVPVLVDFEQCREVDTEIEKDEPLESFPGWFDVGRYKFEGTNKIVKKNDWDAFEEVGEWLKAPAERKYKYDDTM